MSSIVNFSFIEFNIVELSVQFFDDPAISALIFCVASSFFDSACFA
jgi:hypothetical protein